MDSDDNLGPKAAAFITELEALCRKHGVQLSSSGYDGLQVWDLTDPERPLHCAGIDDRMIEQK